MIVGGEYLEILALNKGMHEVEGKRGRAFLQEDTQKDW